MHIAATFARSLFVSGIVQKIVERFEQEGPKTSAIRVRALEEMTFKEHNKKILGKILCIRNRVTVPADESENRSPVGLAKLTQCIARSLSADATVRARKHDAPACGGETRRKVFGRSADVRSHERELWYLRIC